MRKVLCMLSFLCICYIVEGQTIYNQSFEDINSNSISLGYYQGKRILIIIAPSRIHDSSKIDQLVQFKGQYGDSVQMIGVLSYDDGYADSNRTAIISMYQSRGVNIILTNPVYTRKASSSQSPLMQWLTHISANKRFDTDVLGANQKFFIGRNGKLYAVIQPEVPLDSDAVLNVMQRKN